MRLSESILYNLKEAEETKRKREIPIGLKDEKSRDVLNAVVGQLSDGIWENSPGMERYWRFASGLDDNGNLVVYNGYEYEPSSIYGSGRPKWCYSAFNEMDDEAVKRYFANKIKQIVKEEGLEWNRNNTEHSDYLDYNSGVTVRDAYRVYDRLLGRIDRITESSIPSLKDSEFKDMVLRDFQIFMEDKYNVESKEDLDKVLSNVSEEDINEYFTNMFYDIWDTEDLDSANAAEKIIRDKYYALEDIEEEE